MSAARHPYDIRNERGHFVRVTPEVRQALESMRGPPAPYCDAIYRAPKRSWLERLIRRWMWSR